MPELISKFFRVAVEGDTVDGRALTKKDITDIGTTYNPNLYGARVWVEHVRSYLPDSPFRAYGDITETKAEAITEDGPLKGKMALYAKIKPLPELVELNKQGQKIYSSVEIHPKFSQTKGAYLMGLAVTDSPASVGTEVLKFSLTKAQSEHLLFTSQEPIDLAFDEVEPEKPGLFARVQALFAKKNQSDDARFKDVHQAVEEVATEVANQGKQFAKKDELAELKQKLEAHIKDYNELKHAVETTEARPAPRELATGVTISTSSARY